MLDAQFCKQEVIKTVASGCCTLKRKAPFAINRKEGNDQESIQLPKTFCPRHQRERRMHLKQRHHNQNTTSRKPNGQFLSQKLDKRLSKIKIITRTHVKAYNDRNSKPQQKHRLGTVSKTLQGVCVCVGGGGGAVCLNRFYVATNPRP